jgi:hypothetical protein
MTKPCFSLFSTYSLTSTFASQDHRPL